MPLRLVSTLLLALAISACTTTAPDTTLMNAQRVLLDNATDTTGAHPGPLASDHSSLVIRTRAEWEQLWNAMHADPVTGNPSGFPPPEVDFTRDMVIAIGVGTRSNGCYGAKIGDIVDVDGHRVVVAKEISGDGCPGLVCTKSFVSPVLIVAVERTDEEVYFQWRAETVCQ